MCICSVNKRNNNEFLFIFFLTHKISRSDNLQNVGQRNNDCITWLCCRKQVSTNAGFLSSFDLIKLHVQSDSVLKMIIYWTIGHITKNRIIVDLQAIWWLLVWISWKRFLVLLQRQIISPSLTPAQTWMCFDSV